MFLFHYFRCVSCLALPQTVTGGVTIVLFAARDGTETKKKKKVFFSPRAGASREVIFFASLLRSALVRFPLCGKSI